MLIKQVDADILQASGLGISPAQYAAMESLMEFSEAMSGLSILDLKQVMEVAIQEGHQMLAIQLAMANQALELCGCRQDDTGKETPDGNNP